MSGDSIIWLDGVEVSSLPLPDRGLDFGDGVFETLLLRGGKPLFSQLHFARLQRGLHALSFPNCLAGVEQLLERASASIAVRQWEWCALRITVTRGAGPRGYAPPTDAVPRVIIMATPLGSAANEPADAAALGLAAIRWPSQPALAGLKHLNRLEQVLAAQECRSCGFDEAVMLDQTGSVVSVTAGNLFLVTAGTLLTPRLEVCGISGTRRELIMHRWAPALGLDVREGTIGIDQLTAADEVFYSNSLVGLRPVASFLERHWRRHDVCAALYLKYRDELA